jgi:hypothetical protein
MAGVPPWHALADRISIINLERRPERRAYMQLLLGRLGVPLSMVSFFSAFDAHAWGTEPFARSLSAVFHQDPSSLLPRTLARTQLRCCYMRLGNASHRCDVSPCGLLACGLSHLSAPSSRGRENRRREDRGREASRNRVLEDDLCPTAALFGSATRAALASPPDGWRLLRLQDCHPPPDASLHAAFPSPHPHHPTTTTATFSRCRTASSTTRRPTPAACLSAALRRRRGVRRHRGPAPVGRGARARARRHSKRRATNLATLGGAPTPCATFRPGRRA